MAGGREGARRVNQGEGEVGKGQDGGAKELAVTGMLTSIQGS